jgi:hypothetical protein
MRRISGFLTYGSVAAAVAVVGVLAGQGVAQASGTTLWVSTATTVAGNGTSCADPGFNTIQSAITAAPLGATIDVCAGNYTEQLQITQSVTIDGLGNVQVTLPSTPANSTTACDTAKGTGSFQPDQDGIAICGNASVTLDNIVVDAAWPSTTCDDSLYGVLVGGGATLQFEDSAVIAAGAYPLNGCQGGVGLQVGMSWTKPVEVGHLLMSDSWVSGYQKNGITIDGYHSSASISFTTVQGAGPTQQIAQNGIQVSNGAVADITNTTVSGNECSDNAAPCGSNGLTQTQSAGILFYAALKGSTVQYCVLSDNDMGVYYSANPKSGPVKRPQVRLIADQFTDNRYEGVVLDQGAAVVNSDDFINGNVGIEVIQYSSQTAGSFSTATDDNFSQLSNATVDVLSDRAKSDKAGTFTITHSQIYAAKVRDNSKNLPIIHKDDTN